MLRRRQYLRPRPHLRPCLHLSLSCIVTMCHVIMDCSTEPVTDKLKAIPSYAPIPTPVAMCTPIVTPITSLYSYDISCYLPTVTCPHIHTFTPTPTPMPMPTLTFLQLRLLLRLYPLTSLPFLFIVYLIIIYQLRFLSYH